VSQQPRPDVNNVKATDLLLKTIIPPFSDTFSAASAQLDSGFAAAVLAP
jgi:hypothetical protein